MTDYVTCLSCIISQKKTNLKSITF